MFGFFGDLLLGFIIGGIFVTIDIRLPQFLKDFVARIAASRKKKALPLASDVDQVDDEEFSVVEPADVVVPARSAAQPVN